VMDQAEELERRTGLDLGPKTRWSVSSLNDLAEATVDRIGELERSEQQLVLRYLVRPESHAWLDAFLDAVAAGADPRTWGTSGVLVPALAFRELLELPVRTLLERLGLDEEPQSGVVVDPSRDAWDRGEHVAGAPGRQLGSSVDYRWLAPVGTIRMIEPHPGVSPVADPVVATLRWLASRIAFVTSKSPEAMSEAELSPDARLAADVLQRERDQLGEGHAVPGFRAPAAWFRAS